MSDNEYEVKNESDTENNGIAESAQTPPTDERNDAGESATGEENSANGSDVKDSDGGDGEKPSETSGVYYGSARGGAPLVFGAPRYDTSNESHTEPAPAPAPAPESAGKADKKRGVGKSFIAAAVIICVLMSGLFGALGVLVGTQLSGDESTGRSGGGIVINQVSAPVSDTSADDLTGVSRVAALIGDSVVEITTETVRTSQSYGQYVTEGAGSGVIIDATGHIITCAHVVSGATKATVKLNDGTSFEGTIIGSDAQTDIAVVKIDPGETKLTVASFGDSSTLLVGQRVVAIGNPLGELGGTVTDGIISALDRDIEIDGQAYKLLQTNAAINPGNSGGGLFDMNGNLIGVVNAKSSGSDIEGLGFAIPGNDALSISTQLIESGYIRGRVQLGVMVFEVLSTDDYQTYWEYRQYIDSFGVYIISSESEGLKTGDRIVAIDDTVVSTLADIKGMLAEYEVGDTVVVSVSRIGENGKSKIVDVSITLTEKTQ